MDIGKQQRVIIVEPEKLKAPEIEPVAAPVVERSIYEETELSGDWPLPMVVEAVQVVDL